VSLFLWQGYNITLPIGSFGFGVLVSVVGIISQFPLTAT